jgi:DNA-binding NarL/FixJ family response regulator
MHDLSENSAARKILVVSGASSMQDGLLALLSAMPAVEVVGAAHDAASALRMINEHRPQLTVLDSNLLAGDACSLLREILAGQPPTRCIVLAEDVKELKEFEIAGADAALVKGFPPAQLIAAIERLLPSGAHP